MISVAMCTYNGEKYIREQITSILNQSQNVDEIVICDDRSSDSTIAVLEDIIKKVDYPAIRLYQNEEQLGVTKNFEKALSLCRGDYIFLSDQDDIWENNKVKVIISEFENNRNCLLIFTNAALVDSTGSDLGYDLWELLKIQKKEQYGVSDFTGARFVTGATVAIRRELLEKCIPIPDEWIHDAWLAINASVTHSIVALDEKLIRYRQHDANVIGAKKKSVLDQIKHTASNIDKSIEFREIMVKRFESFVAKNNTRLSNAEKTEIEKCIHFWQDTGSINNCSFIRGIRIVLKNLADGNYRKYNHGLTGFAIDLFILLQKRKAACDKET